MITVNKSICNILQPYIICVLIVDSNNMRIFSLFCTIVLLRKLFTSRRALKNLFDVALDANIANTYSMVVV